ncbi:MAG: hypothetical protein A2W33_08350 [Chloroflexi bacterium RBG_16_52_11]|nr:MAG: hypothetical protein A2W33_08350 [Chloroflexi bacterium RBG_16_52_11]
MNSQPGFVRLLRLLVFLTLLPTMVSPVQADFTPSMLLNVDTLWEQSQTEGPPPARYIHGMAYDSARRLTVLFGGDGTGRERRNDTWEYDGFNWIQAQPAQSPPGRVNIQGAMAFDSNRSRVVLFAGLGVPGYLNDTWEYNGSTWTQVNPAVAPSARDSHAMVYDSDRRVIVLFGGYNPSTNYLSDTWEYNGSNWQQVNTPLSPPGRHHHAMVYDSQRRVVVLYAGHAASDPQMEDTWEYNGTTWQQIAPAQSPPGRGGHSMAYDSQRGVAMLYGGTANGSDPLSDTWEYNGVSWQQITPAASPPARLGFPLVYDSYRDRVVLFGGASRLVPLNVFNDTWEYNEDPTPRDRIVQEARLDISMPYDIDRGCASPYSGCGKPYHGFSAGVNTDIALDAYGYGASLDIQSGLVQDHNAHPGRYLFGTARYAEDLQRFFEYNQQIIPHQMPYLKGDIAFFDWDGDSITDHTTIITQVDASGRPLWLVDARGYSANNLNGKAAEVSWSGFYEQYQPEHGRLGISPPGAPVTTTQTMQALRIRLSNPAIEIRLQDAKGKFIAESYNEDLVASNVKDFIPYLPASSYNETPGQTELTVLQPLDNSLDYHVELSSQAVLSYTLNIATLEDGAITDQQTYTQTIGVSETQRIDIALKEHPGFVINSTSFSASPTVQAPDLLALSGTIDSTPQITFTISETGGSLPLTDAGIVASIQINQMGDTIPSSRLTLSPNSFSLAAAGSQQVTLQVDLAGIPPGMYHGHLLVTSQNATPINIPLTVIADPYKGFIPLIVHI